MEPGLKLTRTSRAEQDSREYSKLRFAQRSIDHLFKMLPRYGWPVTVSLRQRSQVCSGMLLNNAGLWGNISYIILSSQIIPVVGIYLPHLTSLQFFVHFRLDLLFEKPETRPCRQSSKHWTGKQHSSTQNR